MIYVIQVMKRGLFSKLCYTPPPLTLNVTDKLSPPLPPLAVNVTDKLCYTPPPLTLNVTDKLPPLSPTSTDCNPQEC